MVNRKVCIKNDCKNRAIAALWLLTKNVLRKYGTWECYIHNAIFRGWVKKKHREIWVMTHVKLWHRK